MQLGQILSALTSVYPTYLVNDSLCVFVQVKTSLSSCGCFDYNLDSGDDYLAILTTMLDAPSLLAPFDAETKRTVISIICRARTNDGDHLQVRQLKAFQSSVLILSCQCESEGWGLGCEYDVSLLLNLGMEDRG